MKPCLPSEAPPEDLPNHSFEYSCAQQRLARLFECLAPGVWRLVGRKDDPLPSKQARID
jgi:hypothetical protein